MLTPPALSTDTIIASLRDAYGLSIREVSFLPIGADINTAVYRVEADNGAPYFLKLRRGDFDEVAVAVPAFLHARGIQQVMAPITTITQRLWTTGHGFAWILYPFMAGSDGYDTALSPAQWVVLGQCLKAIHTTELPPELSQRMPRENYSPQWRDIVEGFTRQVETSAFDDPIAANLAVFWGSKRDEIRAMVERAGRMAQALEGRASEMVLCHGDLHPGNILLGVNDEFAIVDWDNPLLALKEHDLMATGGGVTSVWSDPHEETLLYQGYSQGYGSIEIDLVALSYYRYERIIADLAAYGEQIFGVQGGVEDREVGLRRVTRQFLPNEVVDIAHRTFQRLTEASRDA